MGSTSRPLSALLRLVQASELLRIPQAVSSPTLALSFPTFQTAPTSSDRNSPACSTSRSYATFTKGDTSTWESTSPQGQYSSPRSYATSSRDDRKTWEFMVQQGHKINPCNSPLHPAVTETGIKPSEDELSVQMAYTPDSQCFGCGPAHPDGLRLGSKRILNGLEANVVLSSKYCAFPGIINGGIISTLLDCHGNWTAAISLMDRSCLPKPPLTLTASMLVTYKEPTPPDAELVVRSKVIDIRESSTPGFGKASVEVDISLFQKGPEGEKLLVHGTGIFKRMGALRAM